MVKFSNEMVKELCKARENGLNISNCARYCNINRSTIYDWLNKGKQAKKGKYKEFYKDFNKANSKFKLYHLNKIASV